MTTLGPQLDQVASEKQKEAVVDSVLSKHTSTFIRSSTGQQATLSAAEQDAKFRAKVPGGEQVKNERAMLDAENGVHVLFTPTQGTPLMIKLNQNGEHEVPDGLIPEARKASYETSVKPRVLTTHAMPEKGINCIYIRHSSRDANDQFYKKFLEENPKRTMELVISKEKFNQLKQETDMPAAFNYFTPKNSEEAEFGAVFGKQINSVEGNKLTDPGFYKNREQDLKAVNIILKDLFNMDLKAIAALDDLTKLKQTPNQDNAQEQEAKKGWGCSVM